MNQYDLSDQVAVVTGGAQGIGLAVARRLAASGARLALWDRDEGLARESAASLGEGHRAYGVDVADTEAVAALAARTASEMGPVAALVTSAGIAGSNGKVVDYDPAEWRRVIEINLTGTYNCCRAVLPQMMDAGYGRIVTIASIAGKEGNPNAGAYSASKGGVIALTKSLGKEHAGQNIAVNCVTPATARTRILEQLKPEFIDYMLSRIPRGRFLEVEEAASMIAWLCSPENSFTTGAVFDLSGGRATY
ncbi:3-oxoacyl-[acyl-carrier protein] reductase [Rubellimicrobium mesophilum DSM 19309]|uniref:3-oxoacyl-[acyl-carrier protein] reductase n=1 Tax=Rubellimicrobium mesophilum DSM 19309 TaxID=442562 RepID=A0A017HAT2_9RHOB|nr:SDR family NAD(P)-dependent oxidoreductase [Rubellimicrobium mesophilum]EYD71577.1 3-oxoacyl-[acyl-carrier protein] reductase [Rubellimicrobium mesophilum DSM 19309]